MVKKTQWRFFHIFQYEEEAQYLRDMHKAGWEFDDMCIVRYRFRKCEPRDMVYQLDYNKEGMANKEEYLRMFADCGWEHAGDYMGYSYFRKPADEMKEGEEGIFCDDESRAEMAGRVFKGRMTPLLVLLSGVIVPQLFLQARLGNIWLAWIYGAIFALYLTIFITFGVLYRRYRAGKTGK